jgi:hypothetical protein
MRSFIINTLRQIKEYEGGRHVTRMGGMRNTYRVLVGRSEGKRQLGRPRGRWEDNIGMDLDEI